jgi:hypothetical protein
MASTTRRGAGAASKPESQATSYVRGQQQAASRRGLILFGILLWVVLPRILPLIPAKIASVRWKALLAPGVSFLWMTLPPDGVPLPIFFPRAPIVQWANWGLAAFGAFVCLTLFLHLISLYVQRTKPLTATRIYRQVRVPVSVTLKPTDGVTLLRTLHGMLPPANAHQGTPAPLILRWTARPERRVQQGMSILDRGDLAVSIGKIVEGIAGGTKGETKDDPLLAELKPGRWLCACDLTLTAPSDIPIALGSTTGNPLLESLLPALAPQTGIICADVQVILEPAAETSWKLRVRARQEQLKADLSATEKRALDAKAQGPGFRCGVRLLAVADKPDAGQVMVRTMSAAFAGSAQSIGTTEQRLRAGPVITLPAVLPPREPLPKTMRRVAWIMGLVLALVLAVLVRHTVMLWPIPALSLFIPVLAVASWRRRKTQADLHERHAGLLMSVLPPRNPRCVPVWAEWLGRND